MMESLYQLSGISRQGYHKSLLKSSKDQMMWQRMLEMIFEIRKDYPRISARKIHYMLGINEVGINRFEQFVSKQGLTVQNHRSFLRTTHRGENIYPNLTHGMRINGLNQLWVSDITYFLTSGTTFYLVFILDVYSQRIIGHSASDNMFAVNNVLALLKALKLRGYSKYNKLIHHSDKGSQYGSNEYTKVLKDHSINISMAENCLENPYAERINGIIKNDYMIKNKISSLNELKTALNKAVALYNQCPNGSLGMLTPIDFELAVEQSSANENPILKLYDFTKSYEENTKLGFLRYKSMRMYLNKNAVALSLKTTAGYSPGSDYSLASCPPAELASASSDQTKLSEQNQKMNLSYKQLK